MAYYIVMDEVALAILKKPFARTMTFQFHKKGYIL